MKTLDKRPCTSPNANQALAEYQQLLAWLLGHCYGLELNDTPYHDVLAITQQIEHGVTVRETINELVEKFELVRIDRPGFSLMAQDPTLSGGDMLRARSALGLRSPPHRRIAWLPPTDLTLISLRQPRTLALYFLRNADNER